MLMNVRHVLGVVAIVGLLSNAACGRASPPSNSEYQPQVGQAGKDVVWVPTPQAVVDRMLDMAGLRSSDYLVDLGSGDGRTVIAAARRGVKAHGIEFNPDLVALARRAAERAGLAERATFVRADVFESDFSDATVVSLFLLSELNLRLRPALLAMKPGTRIVSNSFDMGEWKPDQTARAESCESFCTAYLWIVPAVVQGTWKMSNKTLTLQQSFQMLDGTLRDGSGAVTLQEARLRGSSITFTIGNDRYVGQIDGATMSGTVNGSSTWRASRAP